MKSNFGNDLACRFCHLIDETQEHILRECEEFPDPACQVQSYDNIFNNQDIQNLDKCADKIVELLEHLGKSQIPEIKPRNRR